MTLCIMTCVAFVCLFVSFGHLKLSFEALGKCEELILFVFHSATAL